MLHTGHAHKILLLQLMCWGPIHHFYSISPAHTEPFMHSSHFKMLRGSGHVRREGIFWCQRSWNFFCQGTDILLADAALLLVVDNCFAIFSSFQHRPAATSQHEWNFSRLLYATYQNNSCGWQQVRGLYNTLLALSYGYRCVHAAFFCFSPHAVCDWCSCLPKVSFLWVDLVSIGDLYTVCTPQIAPNLFLHDVLASAPLW